MSGPTKPSERFPGLQSEACITCWCPHSTQKVYFPLLRLNGGFVAGGICACLCGVLAIMAFSCGPRRENRGFF